ncbi:TPA: hypothetical protein ACH9PN_005058, partial [Escherichia coli]
IVGPLCHILFSERFSCCLKLCAGLIQCCRVPLRFLTGYLSFRSGNVCHLVTNLTNELRLLQSLLLFFPVKDGKAKKPAN